MQSADIRVRSGRAWRGRSSLALLVALVCGTGPGATVQPIPPDLSRLLARAGLESPIVRWCRGEFRSGRTGAYALAIAAATGGRYIVVESDGTLADLASFSGGADLSCYTPAEIRELDLTIRRSETIHGRVAAPGTTAVVCGFVDDTKAVCWQYSPAERVYVTVGGWIT